MASKRILVIGGTGAMGFEVVKALLSSEPPFTVRVLSRNPDAPSVQKAFDGLGVELVKGSFMDMTSVASALEDCYGVFVNTDGFVVKEADETWAGMRIFELSKWARLRHFVYAGTDYYLKIGGFNPKHAAGHTNPKGRVQEYMKAQPSSSEDGEMAWSIMNPVAYLEQLHGGLFTPKIEPDGTRVFALPLGEGKLALESLPDIAAFTLAIFKDPKKYSGVELNTASNFASGYEIAETLQRVAGVKAVYKPVTIDEWIASIPFSGAPKASSDPTGPTVADNFRLWWPGFQESLLIPTRNMKMLKEIHPGMQSLEEWMVTTGYDGSPKPFLKAWIDNKMGPGF